MKNKSYNNFFVNFANRTKLAIILTLMSRSLSVNEIANKINEEQSNVSHHLKGLSNCRILNAEKKGKQRIYSLNRKTVEPMLKLVSQHISKNCCVPYKNKCLKCEDK